MKFDLDENIAELIAKPPVQYIPPPRYISKHRKAVRSAAARGKSAHKTLGVPSVPLTPPSEFLRKRSRPEPRRDDIKHKHYHIPGYQHKLPPWEKIKVAKKESKDEAESAKKEDVPTQDFKKRNIVNATKLQPQKPRMYYVDDRRGNSYPLIPSGLYPLYRNRKSLRQLKKKSSPRKLKTSDEKKMDAMDKKLLAGIEGEPERASKSSGDRVTIKSGKTGSRSSERKTPSSAPTKPPMCRYVTEAERADLLYGMKKKWEEMMHKFQCLPFLTDTPPKAKRKAKMEEDLKQLEKDIDLIERHPYIYVYEGDQ